LAVIAMIAHYTAISVPYPGSVPSPEPYAYSVQWYYYRYVITPEYLTPIYEAFPSLNNAISTALNAFPLLQLFMRPVRPRTRPDGTRWTYEGPMYYADQNYGVVEWAPRIKKFFFFEFLIRDRDPYLTLTEPATISVTLPATPPPPVERRPGKNGDKVKRYDFPWLDFWKWFEPLLPSWLQYAIDALDPNLTPEKIQALFEKICGDQFQKMIEERSKQFAKDQLERMWEEEFKEMVTDKIEQTIEEVAISELETEIVELIE
jgi:hypothetical protein